MAIPCIPSAPEDNEGFVRDRRAFVSGSAPGKDGFLAGTCRQKKTDPFSYPPPGLIDGTIWKTRQEAIDRPEEYNGKPTGK